MRLTKLYISPHYDDAVFSCAGKILNDVKNGFRVIVVTVFSQGDDTEKYKIRQKENEHALRILNVQHISLDFKDAPSRHHYYTTFRKLILQRHASDNEAFVTKIEKALVKLYHKFNPCEVYAPLGVGSHIDHRICFEAANKQQNFPVIFYEDRPYCFTKFAIEARFKTLGIKDTSSELTVHAMTQTQVSRYLASLSNMQYVKKYLPAGKERTDCFNLITSQLTRVKKLRRSGFASIHCCLTEELKIIRQAVGAYKSQIYDFLASVEHFQAQAKHYSNSLSQTEQYVERYWQLQN